MSSIEVVVRENKSIKPETWRVSLPANVAVKRLLRRLIARLELDTQHSSGFQFVYKLGKESLELLSDDKTLSEEGVVKNDVLLLVRGFGDGDSVQEAIDATRSIMARASHFLPPLCSRDRTRFAADSKIICCPVCGRPYHNYCWRNNGNSCSQADCTGFGKLKSVEIIDALWNISFLCMNQDGYLNWLNWFALDHVNESERKDLENLIDDIMIMENDIDELIDDFAEEYDNLADKYND